ncbi:uncharacterized protein BT62DRAFT_679968 [Guyanagaster necrorhizus]|uniref:Uncharacterized protein n=1 Tax=Guyanagaster necrorhizus TaxID=856835 RepID=A0A9P8AWX8_9AGAR|nr:uncharacterized protein BT62DRAFT_679968 [Guyanagaster necrorhizus MCA 3950]KAG7449362.1 hypothetical protein BT62DRAFT_679968 [Guyanagaster necrorhizus MCA 3950]
MNSTRRLRPIKPRPDLHSAFSQDSAVGQRSHCNESTSNPRPSIDSDTVDNKENSFSHRTPNHPDETRESVRVPTTYLSVDPIDEEKKRERKRCRQARKEKLNKPLPPPPALAFVQMPSYLPAKASLFILVMKIFDGFSHIGVPASMSFGGTGVC